MEFPPIEGIVSYIGAFYPNKLVLPFELKGVTAFTMDLEAGTI